MMQKQLVRLKGSKAFKVGREFMGLHPLVKPASAMLAALSAIYIW